MRHCANPFISFTFSRCPRCSAEITFKTDPQNSDYVAENGVSRNFEPWRGDDGTVVAADDDAEEQEDAMASLESRTLDSKREMEIMDALDEIRTRNARSERVSVDDVLDRYSNEIKEQVQERLSAEEQRDEEEAAAAFKSADGISVRKVTSSAPPVSAIDLVRQQRSQADQTEIASPVSSSSSFGKQSAFSKRKLDNGPASNSFGIFVKKKKVDLPSTPSTHTPPKAASNNNALSMLASYSDDDSGSD